MKPPVSFQDSTVNGDSSLTRSDSYKASITNSNSTNKPFTPYFDYSNTYTGQDLLKPPSRSSSKNRRTAFAEPLETTCDPNPMPNQLSEIANCENPVNSSYQNINEDGNYFILSGTVYTKRCCCRCGQFYKGTETNTDIFQHYKKKAFRLKDVHNIICK